MATKGFGQIGEMNRVHFVIHNLRNALLCATLFAVFLGGGTFVVLTAASAVGYLPYSDRPGPGWFYAHLPTREEMGFYLGFAIFLLGPFALLWGAILWLFIKLVSWFGAPRWYLRSFGGLFSGILGFLGVAAAGWYIAISAMAVYAGLILGSLFGAFLLSRFSSASFAKLGSSARWTFIVGITVTFATAIVYPLLPDRDQQQVQVEVFRLVAGQEEINSNSLRPEDIDLLKSLNLRGTMHFGISSNADIGAERHARVLVVVREPVVSTVTLLQPKGTDVVYVQEGSQWRMFPSDAPTLRRKITLSPGNKADLDGGALSVDPVMGEPSTFTWYPPLSKAAKD